MITPQPKWISKLEVAERQLREAVRLFFEERDPVATHSVAAAGHQVLLDIAAKQGTESLIKPKSASVPHMRSANYPTNFFKHADKDPQGRINIVPLNELNAELLMDAVLLFQRYAGRLFFEGKLFWTWYVSKNRSLFEGSVPPDGVVQSLIGLDLNPDDFEGIRNLLLLHYVTSGEAIPHSIASVKHNSSHKEKKTILKPSDPSPDYLSELASFEKALPGWIDVSQKFAGLRCPPRHCYASILFTCLCTKAVSLVLLVPRSSWSKHKIEHWDYASVANITRTILEARLSFHYLCIDKVDQQQWECRWNLFKLHDCVSRRKLFEVIDGEDAQLKSFGIQAEELRTKLKSNTYFTGLPPKQKHLLLKGGTAFLCPLETIAGKAGISSNEFKLIYRFLSSHVHCYPVAFFRMGEQERGRGVHSNTEESHTTSCIMWSRELIDSAAEEMKELFSSITDGHRPLKGDN